MPLTKVIKSMPLSNRHIGTKNYHCLTWYLSHVRAHPLTWWWNSQYSYGIFDSFKEQLFPFFPFIPWLFQDRVINTKFSKHEQNQSILNLQRKIKRKDIYDMIKRRTSPHKHILPGQNEIIIYSRSVQYNISFSYIFILFLYFPFPLNSFRKLHI